MVRSSDSACHMNLRSRWGARGESSPLRLRRRKAPDISSQRRRCRWRITSTGRRCDSAFGGGGLLARCALALGTAAPCAALAAALSLADFEAGLASRNGWRIAETELVLADALVRREAGNAGLRATGAFAGGAPPQPPVGGPRGDG